MTLRSCRPSRSSCRPVSEGIRASYELLTRLISGMRQQDAADLLISGWVSVAHCAHMHHSSSPFHGARSRCFGPLDKRSKKVLRTIPKIKKEISQFRRLTSRAAGPRLFALIFLSNVSLFICRLQSIQSVCGSLKKYSCVCELSLCQAGWTVRQRL